MATKCSTPTTMSRSSVAVHAIMIVVTRLVIEVLRTSPVGTHSAVWPLRVCRIAAAWLNDEIV